MTSGKNESMENNIWDHKTNEAKWVNIWEQNNLYKTPEIETGDKKKYVLVAFPYPSATGLHVGHPLSYVGGDIYARFCRANRFKVLWCMGWDAFGLPTENFAKKMKIPPFEITKTAIETYKKQLGSLGTSFDWSREINTSDPSYYKWTQWFFQLLYKKGLAYKKEALVNWDPVDKTVLANEQVLPDGTADRSGALVEQKMMSQWFFKITDYAERLLNDLDTLDWPESTKSMQRNWIGKSEGANVDFEIENGNKKGKKTLIFMVHGGNSDGTVQQKIGDWKIEKNQYSTLKGSPVWSENLDKFIIGKKHQFFNPTFPNSSNANYQQWKEFFELAVNFKLETELKQEGGEFSEIVLVGHSLGTIFLQKYLVENNFSDKFKIPISSLHFAGCCCGAGDLQFSNNWKNISGQCGDIQIYHSTDDLICPFSGSKIYYSNLPGSIFNEFSDRGHFEGPQFPELLNKIIPKITVFTTRIDTIFSGTFLLLAPEHRLVGMLTTVDQKQAVNDYQQITKQKSKLERTDLNKNWTGVFTGSFAINPANGEKMPIWLTDFVLADYGTGAVFADAHDQRDHYLGVKYNIPLKESVAYNIEFPLQPNLPIVKRNVVKAVLKHWQDDKYLVIKEKKFDGISVLIGGGVESGQTLEAAIRQEITEESGFTDFKTVELKPYKVHNKFYNKKKNQNQYSLLNIFYVELESGKQVKISNEEQETVDYSWVSGAQFTDSLTNKHEQYLADRILNNTPYTGTGILFNSMQFDGMSSENAKPEIIKWGEKQGWAKKVVNYKLRDWSIGRQRYWGCPIPVMYNWESGIKKEQLIPEKDLPLVLPIDLDLNSGLVSPLGENADFIKSASLKYGYGFEYEGDTMDTFVCSSWYFFRYCSGNLDNNFTDIAEMKKWMAVDNYIIGAEHATMHLLYARFFTKVLQDAGYINFSEPFLNMKHQGMVLGLDNQKMSKSKGNTISPDEIYHDYGADTLRLYEMFMGPFDQPKPWSADSIKGVRRFIEKVWKLQFKTIPQNNIYLESDLNLLIQKVAADIETYNFNTCVSQFMKFVNLVEKADTLGIDQYRRFLITLSPFAPFVTEEIWSSFEKTSIHTCPWPQINTEFLVKKCLSYPVQINGKVRAQIEIPENANESEILNIAIKATGKWLESGKITFSKIIIGKMVTIAVKYDVDSL